MIPPGLAALDDSKLGDLLALLDEKSMSARIAEYLRAEGLPAAWSVARCAVERASYRPGRNCDVLYRLTLRGTSGSEADEWVSIRKVPAESTRAKFERAARAAPEVSPACDCLRRVRAVGYWRDLDVIVSIFPHDLRMPGLAHVVNPGSIRALVEARPGLFGAPGNGRDDRPGDWRCAEVRFERLKYMPGKRCVLHFRVGLSRGSDERIHGTFISKTYRSGASRDHFRRWRSAWEQLRAERADLDLPKPLLHWDGTHSLWLSDWEGTPLVESVAGTDGEALMGRAARVLASLHRSGIKRLPRAPGRHEILQATEKAGARCSVLSSVQGPLVGGVLQRLRAAAEMARDDGPHSPVHGACRAEQMLVRGGDVTLVDFDALASGDPLLDVAEFLASLRFLEIGAGLPRPPVMRAAAQFLESYGQQVPWALDRGRIAWYATAFLIQKTYETLKHLDLAAMVRLASVGEELFTPWIGEAE